MKTSKWFYGLALASAVSFTAAADNVPGNQPVTTAKVDTLPTLHNNLIIQGPVKTDSDKHDLKPVTKPVSIKDKDPKVPAYTGAVVNQGT